jgi:PAP2 superfamily
LVAALYTRRRVLWWVTAISVWTLVVLVAMSRVWLGVHWASDVIAAIALAVIGVAVAERYVVRPHCACSPNAPRSSSGGASEADDVGLQTVDRPVLEAPA